MIAPIVIMLACSLVLAVWLLVNEIRYADRLRQALNRSADAICAGRPGEALCIAESALEGKA